jgi:hypothetical protein
MFLQRVEKLPLALFQLFLNLLLFRHDEPPGLAQRA